MKGQAPFPRNPLSCMRAAGTHGMPSRTSFARCSRAGGFELCSKLEMRSIRCCFSNTPKGRRHASCQSPSYPRHTSVCRFFRFFSEEKIGRGRIPSSAQAKLVSLAGPRFAAGSTAASFESYTRRAQARRSLPRKLGRGRIRTHEPREGLPVFKTGAIGHSATLPNKVNSVIGLRVMIKEIVRESAGRFG